MLQFVFALEKASVAAANKDTSVEKVEEEDDSDGFTGSSIPEVFDGISFGSWLEVSGAGFS